MASLLLLSLASVLVAGFHPLAEDGGLYVAGLEFRLQPSLFPHDRAFVTAHLRWSVFAPALATAARLTHAPLPALLAVAQYLCLFLTLYAAFRLARLCIPCDRSAMVATALLGAWLTLPIAGTSLLLMDPYVTARTFSTPLSLLALFFLLRHGAKSPAPKPPRRVLSGDLAACAGCLLAAAAFHPLMAMYALGLLLSVGLGLADNRRLRLAGFVCLGAGTLLLAGSLQALSPAESGPALAAAASRSYWFPARWQWFELFGLLGPLMVLFALLRFARRHLTASASVLLRASLFLGALAIAVTALFAREHDQVHAVARLQPLRSFLLLYVVMILLLGAALNRSLQSWVGEGGSCGKAFLGHYAAPLLILLLAATQLSVQRATFPASHHMELSASQLTNPWSQAFLWVRDHTPPDALFALDADYINIPGEDAQAFRSTALRSVLPDLSKDGGEAAITPAVSAAWLAGSTAQQQLSRLSDDERNARLRPFGATWMVLRDTATTGHPCPYRNGVVKVCHF